MTKNITNNLNFLYKKAKLKAKMHFANCDEDQKHLLFLHLWILIDLVENHNLNVNQSASFDGSTPIMFALNNDKTKIGLAINFRA